MYTHVSGQEYEDIAAAWDWNLIPGITVDYGATTLSCDKTGFTGIENFVGGASTGSIGAFAMNYTNPSTKQLQWQKAWFFFRGGMQYVTISGINSKSNNPVFTVLDQKRASGNVLVDGQVISASQNFTEYTSLWHADVGYVFPNSEPGTSLSISIANRSGSWSNIGTSKQPPATVNLFAAYLEHTSTDKSISYTVFPGVSASDFQELLKNRPLYSLSNDVSTSAVLDSSNNDLMVVFWQAGQSKSSFFNEISSE